MDWIDFRVSFLSNKTVCVKNQPKSWSENNFDFRDVRICLLKLNQVFVPFNLGWDTTVILQNSLEWGKLDRNPRTKYGWTYCNFNLRCSRHRFHRRDYRILQFGICGGAGADHWRHTKRTNDWPITTLLIGWRSRPIRERAWNINLKTYFNF